MRIEILLCLLAAFVCSAAANRLSYADQPADQENIRTERSAPALNELARRRKRNSKFRKTRQCCPVMPTGCCQCCSNEKSTKRPHPGRTTTIGGGEVIPTLSPGGPTIVGSKNFTIIIINSAEFWIVFFTYRGPGCIPCGKLNPIIKQTSELLREYPNIRIAIFYVDYGDHRTFLMNELNIRDFPSVYIYCLDKENPYNYGPSPIPEQLVKTVIILITRPKIAVGSCAAESEPFETSDVYELNDRVFEQTVRSCTDETWVIDFYLAWPDVCLKFFKVFEAAAKQLKSRVKFGSFYQTGISQTVKKYGVEKRACWVKMFPKGNKDSCILDFNQGQHGPQFDRTLVSWVEKYLDEEEVQKVCGEKQPPIGEETTTPIDETSTTEEGVPPTPEETPPPEETTTPDVGGDTTTMETDEIPSTTRRPPITTKKSTTRTPVITTTTKSTTQKPTTTTKSTTQKPTTTTKSTTRKPTTTTTTTSTRKPTTTTKTTTTRKPTTTTTKTTTRKPTTTTRRLSTPKRTTPQPPWLESTTKRPTPSTTKSTTPKSRTIPGATVNIGPTVDPNNPSQPLPPNPDVNGNWCKYRCCIVYFLPLQSKCELTCYKKYMASLERSSTRFGTGCALYFEFHGKRMDFEQTFSMHQFPRILIVTTVTRTYVTRDGVVSEVALDQFIDAYVKGQLPMKSIPRWVPTACESGAC